MCTRYPIINKVSELKVHIELTRFVQPEKIEIDANERAVNEKSQYCFFVCTTFDSFLNDFTTFLTTFETECMKGNYLTIGNLSYLYSALKDSEKNTIAKYYSEKYNKQYKPSSHLRISSRDMESALKIFNLIRNQCAHSYCT